MPRPSFIVQESKVALLLIFGFSLGMCILLWFYPGPSYGKFFWAILALFAMILVGVGLKLLILKPVVTIDSEGIRYFRSGIFVKWSQFVSATVHEVPYEDGDTKPYFTLQFYDRNNPKLQQIDLPLGGLLDKNGNEIIAAINEFRKG